MPEGQGTVCVTGGTGFQASWLIMRLLERGYSVRTTVRSHPGDDGRDISYLTSLPGAADRLKIFEADLDRPESFTEAIDGCDGVFHLAFPIDFAEKEPEEVVTKRGVEGTLWVLKACLDSKTVKRVVYTSSQAAVMFTGKGDDVVDENDWSDVDYYRTLNRFGTSYLAAKTTASKAAVEFAEKNGLDLVVLTLSFVIGPFLCPRIPDSIFMALAMVFGNKDLYPTLVKPNFIHTDDAARAYIFLYENPNVKGKYLCSSNEITLNEMSKFLSAKYPEREIPTIESLKDIQGYRLPSLSTKKLLDSGFEFKYGLEQWRSQVSSSRWARYTKYNIKYK